MKRANQTRWLTIKLHKANEIRASQKQMKPNGAFYIRGANSKLTFRVNSSTKEKTNFVFFSREMMLKD